MALFEHFDMQSLLLIHVIYLSSRVRDVERFRQINKLECLEVNERALRPDKLKFKCLKNKFNRVKILSRTFTDA